MDFGSFGLGLRKQCTFEAKPFAKSTELNCFSDYSLAWLVGRSSSKWPPANQPSLMGWDGPEITANELSNFGPGEGFRDDSLCCFSFVRPAEQTDGFVVVLGNCKD